MAQQFGKMYFFNNKMDLFEEAENFQLQQFKNFFPECQSLETSEEDLHSKESTYNAIAQVATSSHSLASLSINISSEFRKVVVKKFPKNDSLEYMVHIQLRHPNIVQVVDCFEEDKELSLVTEFHNQADYFRNRILEQANPINNELKLKSYLTDTAEALNYLHSLGYVHCDVRLNNLYCSKNTLDFIRTVSLADFGLVQRTGTKLTIPLKKAILERLPHPPRDLLLDEPIDEKFDIFCLGVVLYQLCVAYSPCIVVKYNQMLNLSTPSYRGQVPIRKSDWIDKDIELYRLVKSMMHPNPKKRPSAAEVLEHPWLQV